MSCVAIITARGGSKRIPRKNVKEFCGKPIIAYSIEAAIESGVFDEVMVSTDDNEIAQTARNYGAKIPFIRSEKNANDYATTMDVLREVINEYKNLGVVYDELCCIYPTAPFVTPMRFKQAYKIFSSSNADALMPVVEFSFPPLRGVVCKDNEIKFKWPEYEKIRSQDIEPLYHDAGQFYFSKTKLVLEKGSFMAGRCIPFVLSELEVQDIDSEIDWKMAELKYKLLNP